MRSTTPTGTPPKNFISLNEPPKIAPAAAPTPDTSAILKALADMAKSNTAGPGMPSQASSNNVSNIQNPFTHNMSSSVNPNPAVPPITQAVSVPGFANGVLPSVGPSSVSNLPQNLFNGQLNMQPNAVIPPGGASVTPESLQQQFQIIQALQAQNVPPDQWAAVLSVLMSSQTGAAPNPSNFGTQQGWQQPNGGYGRDEPSRDRNGYNDQYMRSPPGRYRNPRSRSRSPQGWERRCEPSPPRRRDSPVYGDYSGDPSGRNGRGNYSRQGRGRGAGNDYRQRSPPPDRFRRSASPHRQEQTLPPPGPKWIEYDRSLGEGNIKGKNRLLNPENQSSHLSSIKQNVVCWRRHVSRIHAQFQFNQF